MELLEIPPLPFFRRCSSWLRFDNFGLITDGQLYELECSGVDSGVFIQSVRPTKHFLIVRYRRIYGLSGEFNNLEQLTAFYETHKHKER